MALFKKFQKLFSSSRKGKKRKPGTSLAPRREPKLESSRREDEYRPGISPRRQRSSVRPRVSPKAGRSGLRQRLRWLPALLGLGFTFLIMGMIVLAYFGHDLPDIDKLSEVKKTPGITLVSQDGTTIGAYGDIYGDYLAYKDFPKPLVDAVIATEDRRFFAHSGVDPWGIARAMWANFKARKLVQGGSTITQQVAKNVFLTPERTLKRKVQELLLAFWLERKFSKKEILTIYLNRVYLGAGNFGVDAAAKRYFDKSARQITLPEAAILAGLLKAPSRYAPTSNPELTQKRASQVLYNMVDAELLEKAQAEKAIKQFPALLAPSRQVSGSGKLYFTDWVVETLPDFIGNVEEDIVVTTTLQPRFQQLAEAAVEKLLTEKGAQAHAAQGALVSMTPEGAILAMVGGRDYTASQYNRAVQARRQPGSAFKLFVYLAALETGLTPYHQMEDAPLKIGKWQPKNYDGRYHGVMTLREAFAESINTIAVRLSEGAGRGNVIAMARRLGIGGDLRLDGSIALGSSEVTLLDLTTGYAHMANNGVALFPYAIREIRTAKGRVLYHRESPDQLVALGQDTVEMMNEMLLAVVTGGTGRGAQIGRPAAGKTGTSQDFRDAWFIGFVPQLVTGVWVGNDDATSMQKVTGGAVPAAIWREYMRPALENTPVAEIPHRSGASSWLPWSNPGPEQIPASPGAARRQERQGDDGVGLTPSFWNKLFDGGKVEYDYPDPNRR